MFTGIDDHVFSYLGEVTRQNVPGQNELEITGITVNLRDEFRCVC